MNTKTSYQLQDQVLSGIALIAIGIILLLDHMNILSIGNPWHYAPLALVATGIVQMARSRTAANFSEAIWSVAIGLLLFAQVQHLFGLTFANGWPILIIVTGITMAISPVRFWNVTIRKEQRNVE